MIMVCAEFDRRLETVWRLVQAEVQRRHAGDFSQYDLDDCSVSTLEKLVNNWAGQNHDDEARQRMEDAKQWRDRDEKKGYGRLS